MHDIEIEILAEEQGVTVKEVIQWCRSKGLFNTDALAETTLSGDQAEMIRSCVEERVIIPTRSYVHSHNIPFLHIPA
jgi:hypothetical protein